MSYTIVLADRVAEANSYVKQVSLPRGRWRFANSASSLRGLKVAEIHELPSFVLRRDRHAINAELRFVKGVRIDAFARPELDDELLDWAYDHNEGRLDISTISAQDIYDAAITVDKIHADVINADRIISDTIGADPRGPLTERQLEVAYRYNALRIAAVSNTLETEDPTAPVEKPKQRRRSKCPTCDELDFKDTHACPIAMRPPTTAADFFGDD